MSDLPVIDRETCMDAFAAKAAEAGAARRVVGGVRGAVGGAREVGGGLNGIVGAARGVIGAAVGAIRGVEVVLRRGWRRSGCWPLVLGVFLGTLGAVTWRQWTVPVFPLDAGREMLIPRLIADGQVLYREIRCFYGPLGYWLNAAAVALWGDGQDVLWALNLTRMAVTLVVLWLLARQLLDRALAAVALGSWAYTCFYSLAVPYTAAVGWGILLLASGALCAARQLGNGKAGAAASSARSGGMAWGIAAALLLSLAATTKHEYALAAAVLMIVLVGDAWLRLGFAAAVAIGVAAAAPFAVVAAAVLRTVTLGELVYGNLWIPEMVRYYGGPAAYGPGAALGVWKALHLAELLGLLAIGVGFVQATSQQVNKSKSQNEDSLAGDSGSMAGRSADSTQPRWGRNGRLEVPRVAAARQPWASGRNPVGVGRAWHAAHGDGESSPLRTADTAVAHGARRGWGTQRGAVVLMVLGLGIVGAVEGYIRAAGVTASWPMDYPKSRLHSLVQYLHLLCLPLALGYVGLVLGRVWRRGAGAAWRRLGAPGRVGVLCAAGYLSLMSRQVPSASELMREPFTPILLAWLLAVVLPRVMRWRYGWRQAWAGGVVALHLAGIASAVDHVNYYQSRPACFVEVGAERAFVWQRRMPFKPCWFSDAIETVRGHEAEIREGGIACVPEGGWVNALFKLDWPTRDTQWMTYCQEWVREDLARSRPEFLLVMDPALLAYESPRVYAVIDALYREVERNPSGMILYRLRAESRELWRPETDRQELERGTGWDRGHFAMRGDGEASRFECSHNEGQGRELR